MTGTENVKIEANILYFKMFELSLDGKSFNFTRLDKHLRNFFVV